MSAKVGAVGVRFRGVAPHFRVRDVVRTAEYLSTTGMFSVSSLPAFGMVRRDEVSIHLNRAEGASIQPAPDDVADDAYIDVTELDALAQDLRGRGAQIISGPEERVYGRREFIVRDCDGRVLAFGDTARDTAI